MNKESVLTIESIDVSLKVFKPLKDFDSDVVKYISPINFKHNWSTLCSQQDSLEFSNTILS